MVTVKVVITVNDTESKFAYCRVGIREEANLSGNTWKSRMAKKLCFGEINVYKLRILNLPKPENISASAYFAQNPCKLRE